MFSTVNALTMLAVFLIVSCYEFKVQHEYYW